ncbi:hypothetical protein EC973_007016 [Apophysomyces ossiformis]|uniref:MULE transposase domain-containing protein n=1 Tax=Apophysomyces ossiformis TaxID=679940 RepID=A0A8H7EQM6_9FUNG|nr:hypothetical protein EC973_007016 [Apophysomyces ossiformis]
MWPINNSLRSWLCPRPDITPKGLVVGHYQGAYTTPVRDIDESLQNLDRTRYLRSKILKKHRLAGSQESSIEDLYSLQQDFDGYFAECRLLQSNTSIAMHLPSASNFVDFKAHPVLTDVTFGVFKGYHLCSSVIYSKQLARHVLIFAAVIKNTRSRTFKNYFPSFFSTFNISFNNDFLGMVMDFSTAQIKGFRMAYSKLTKRNDELKYLKGCFAHYMRNVDKVDKVDKHHDLTISTYNRSARGDLKSQFPEAMQRLKFWSRRSVHSMIFHSKSEMNNKLLDHPTRTTNGIESYHNDLYRVIRRKRGLVPNLRAILTYMQNSKAAFRSYANGFPLYYGKRAPKRNVASKRRCNYDEPQQPNAKRQKNTKTPETT